MTTNQKSVLLTSAGRRVELVRAFQQAYQSLGIQGDVVATDIDPLAPALHVSDHAYMVPRYDSPEYVPRLVEICRKHDVLLILPLIDPEIPVLADQRQMLESTGALLVLSPTKSVQIAADKWLTFQFFRNINLPTVDSWLYIHVDPAQIEFPVFIKPRYGSAAKNTYKAYNQNELDFFGTLVPDPIIQRFLDGPEITNDVLCDLDGQVLSVVSRQRIEVRSGEVSKGVTVYYPEIAEMCCQIARRLSAIGPFTIQGMMHKGRYLFTEINMRFGGGVPLAMAAGADSPRWLLAGAAGLPPEAPAIGSYMTDLYMTRFDTTLFISEAGREQMASRHIRS